MAKIKNLLTALSIIFSSLLVISCGDVNFDAQSSNLSSNSDLPNTNQADTLTDNIASISSSIDVEEQSPSSQLVAVTNTENSQDDELENELTQLLNSNNTKPENQPATTKPILSSYVPANGKPLSTEFNRPLNSTEAGSVVAAYNATQLGGRPATSSVNRPSTSLNGLSNIFENNSTAIPKPKPTICLDKDGDGKGTKNGSYCVGPKRLDIAVNEMVRAGANRDTRKNYAVRSPGCTTLLSSFTSGVGCFERQAVNSRVFLDFARKVGISQSGAIAKFYPAGNTVNSLDRVMVLVSPFNGSGSAQIDQELNGIFSRARNSGSKLTTLLSYLHSEGISVLYVSYGHPANTSLPVLEKAKALSKVLERFNKLRESRKNSPGYEKANIMGLSLGGIVAKTALTLMEKAGKRHDMNIYFSMDSPHLGAHAPLGLQYLPKVVSSVFSYAKRKTSFAGVFKELFDDILDLDFITKPVAQGGEVFGQISGSADALLDNSLNNIPTRELLAYNIDAKSGYRTKEFLDMRRNTSSLPSQTKKNIAIANGSITGRTLDRTRPYFQLKTAKRNKVQLSLYIQPRGIADIYSYTWLKFPDRNQFFRGSRTRHSSISSKKREVTEDTVPCATSTEFIKGAEKGINKAVEKNWIERVVVNNYETCFVPTASALAVKNGKEFTNGSFNSNSSVFHEIIGGSKNTRHMHFSSEITNQIINKLKQYRK